MWWLAAIYFVFILLARIHGALHPIPTSECSANSAFVYIESSSSTVQTTILSERVNYAPFIYDASTPRRLVVEFAAGSVINDTMNNPCDISTWSVPASYYDDRIVLMEYNVQYSVQCTPQKWTLNLESYSDAKALLISNDKDQNSVFPLHGDETLANPGIPTRMISQNAGANILNMLSGTSPEAIFATIGCFNTTLPSIVCVVDASNTGSHVELDGDFQKQGALSINDHPVWKKEGMNGIWNDYYIWLAIDSSRLLNSWRWVMGTDPNDDNTIIAECVLNSVQAIDDPSQCGHNWYQDGIQLNNLTSTDGICDLGDNYVCVDSGSLFFDSYFSGRYRQVHKNTPVWLSDNTAFDAHLRVEYVDYGFASGWSFVFSYAANGGIYAFCPISSTFPSTDTMLKPWQCNDKWYVVTLDSYGGWMWFDDPLMDVDECTHPSAPSSNTNANTVINYPTSLCFKDTTNSYSSYQSYFGVYVLDNTTQSNGRYIYRNQRLDGNKDSWYMVWYEQKDAWIINDDSTFIPMIQSTFGAACRDNANTPDQCNTCWSFYKDTTSHENCDVSATIMQGTLETDCVAEPVNTVTTYTNDITLCFEDGGAYTGKWKLESVSEYHGRKYWYLDTFTTTGHAEYYLYYDEVWRLWVINPSFTQDKGSFELYCLRWDEFEPFKCDTWYKADGSIVKMNKDCTMSPTESPTLHPTANCIEYKKYVYAESSAFKHQVLTSLEVNFPPYASNTFYDVPLVLFESMTKTTGNPCDSTTWAQPPAYYANNVVMIEYSSFFKSLCTPQQWTLQLQRYANVVAVLVSNNIDLTNVYALSGDASLAAPTIPTRMISQLSGQLIKYSLNDRQRPVHISFGCFDDEVHVPSTICLVDTSIIGEHVYMDGEYQRQDVLINDHPVWLKQGHVGLWQNIYMFLDVDRSVAGHPSWRWVIGTDYNDRNSIIAECNLNGKHISHPAECDHDWSINGTLVSNITTKGTTCALGDNYVCVSSAKGGYFGSYFDGTYRQVHEGVPLWLLENEYIEAHIRVAHLQWNAILGSTPKYVFAFMMNQTELFAFCVIGESYPTKEQILSPQRCNEDWYVLAYAQPSGYTWALDFAFDIDECTHPNITTTQPNIAYPDHLCLADSTNAYSEAQSRYGVYVLDKTTTFDGRYVYRNQRLQNTNNEFFMMWYDEKDSWVLNEIVPGSTVVRNADGICRDEVYTPDLCSVCWEFTDMFGVLHENCNVKATIASSAAEDQCMQLPQNNIIHYTKDIKLCFDDGVSSDPWKNLYTGEWILEETKTHNNRAYWYKKDNRNRIQFYMFYDEQWRYWVIDSTLTSSSSAHWSYLHWHCLKWDEFEPFNCDTWHSATFSGVTMTMQRDCVSKAPTTSPTLSPTQSCDSRDGWIYAETETYVLIEETLTSQHVNFAPYVFDSFDTTRMVLFENGRNMSRSASNPCDYYTWQEYPIFYEDKVVMIYYNSHMASLCSVEQWTLNLEQYGGAKAVLVVNNADLSHVYALPGDDNVQDPDIPTRMISQFAGNSLQMLLDRNEQVLITFGCFDDQLSYPAIICLVDTSPMGTHVYLDGEYQRQSHLYVNDYPVWLKHGYDGLWKNLYMYMDIDQDDASHAWQWVISSNYNADGSGIIAECKLHNIDHPALCDGHWHVVGIQQPSIITSDTNCELGDEYVCVESQSGRFFNYFFDGHYRQVHDGVALWLLEDARIDAYITVRQITVPNLFDDTFVFAFIVNQTDMYAFCPIGNDMPSKDVMLSPWDCNENWYKIELQRDGTFSWVMDYEFDIDECKHDALATDPPQYVSFPMTLCLADTTGSYSRYQGHYGVYELDISRTYDDRYVYYNNRLSLSPDDWFLIWQEAADAWTIKEMIPGESNAFHDNDAICREEVFSPDLCTECWEFSDGKGSFEENCNVKVTVMHSHEESDCMSFDIKDDKVFPQDYTQEITLGFGSDGADSMHKHALSGHWKLRDGQMFMNRPYWYKVVPGTDTIAFYMFYDSTWRYWTIDSVLGNNVASDSNHLYCLKWDEAEPFSCDTWYTSDHVSVLMDNEYEMPSTTGIKEEPVDIVIEESVSELSQFNILPWIVMSLGMAALCAGAICMVCYWRKKKEKRFMFEDMSKNGEFRTVYGVSQNPEDDIDMNMMEMEPTSYAQTSSAFRSRLKGEMVAVRDSDSDGENNSVVIHDVIDDGEGLVETEVDRDHDEDNDVLEDNEPLTNIKSRRKGKHGWIKIED